MFIYHKYFSTVTVEFVDTLCSCVLCITAVLFNSSMFGLDIHTFGMLRIRQLLNGGIKYDICAIATYYMGGN